MCAVCYTRKTGSHNLAAAWGIAVTLGLVYTNDLPAVRLFTNCTYATKIFDGTNKAGKYKDMWHYILSDLLPKVKAGRSFHSINVVHGAPDTSTDRDMRHLLQTGIINPAVPIINSITSCQKYINEMIRLPDSVLALLYELDARPPGIFTAPLHSTTIWHQSTNIRPALPSPSEIPKKDTVSQISTDMPYEASPNQNVAMQSMTTTSATFELDSTCSSSNVSASLLTPRDSNPGTQSSMTQSSLHLHLEATLPTQASIESDLSTTLDSHLSPSPQARPKEVVTISDGDTAPSPSPPSPVVVDLATSQPASQTLDSDPPSTTHSGPTPLDTLVATVNPYIDSTPTDAKDRLQKELPHYGTPTSTNLLFEASVRKAGALLTDIIHQPANPYHPPATHGAPSRRLSHRLNPIG